ncbi:SMP-30/gluconolactonase/LRE family protein [Glycomyces paridis]|uniref:SMP-30/gluconolactonase/LRE family protein n=1 Tax=Glycomyces paridis TaxID=2126555 RepID=A0A4S8PLA2_9ACTN|nr:SMP-30/gluconolactonase/LRE family protein [Glycomyces paridis]THV30881.1 SMP-30/gluconolactonase/LRE family protein [Glycomyces paridis]
MGKSAVRFEVFDERWNVAGDDSLECLYSDGRWTEGPVYVPSGRYLLFSDIPNDRVMRWDETDGSVSVFRSPARYANGHTLDRQGRLVSCEQGSRSVTRTELDGSVTTIADRWNGLRFNSPNDAVVADDGAVWFTDPPYGITSDYEGHRAEPEIDGCHVYRADPSGRVDRVADDFDRPNGLAFSPDGSVLYIADTRRKHLRRFTVEGDGLSGGEVFAESPSGGFDGLRVDVEGRVWAAASDVHCFDPDGTHLATLPVPQPAVSNLVFGGPKRNRLFITATDSVYSMMLNTNGTWRL